MDNQIDSNEWLRWWDEITKRLFVVSFGTTGKWTTGQAIYHEAIGNRTDAHYTGRGSDKQFSAIYLKLFLSYYSQHTHCENNWWFYSWFILTHHRTRIRTRVFWLQCTELCQLVYRLLPVLMPPTHPPLPITVAIEH